MNLTLCARWLVTIVTLTLLSACATSPIEAGARARMKTVGVISMMGDEIVFDRIGTTVFGNDRKTVPTDQFGLHQAGQDALVSSLQGKRGIALEKERLRFTKAVTPSLSQQLWVGGTVNKEAMNLELRRLGAAYGIDSLIILVPGQFEIYGGGSIRGYTMVQRSLFGHESTLAYAAQGIEVYDTRSGARLGFSNTLQFKDVSNAAWHGGLTSEGRECFLQFVKNNSNALLAALELRAPAPPPSR